MKRRLIWAVLVLAVFVLAVVLERGRAPLGLHLPAPVPTRVAASSAFGKPAPKLLVELSGLYAQAWLGRFGADMADGNSWLAATPFLSDEFRLLMTEDYPDAVNADKRWITAHLRGYTMKTTISDCVMNPWFEAQDTFTAGQTTVVRCSWTMTVHDQTGRLVTDRDVDPSLFKAGRQSTDLILQFELAHGNWVISDDLSGRAG